MIVSSPKEVTCQKTGVNFESKRQLTSGTMMTSMTTWEQLIYKTYQSLLDVWSHVTTRSTAIWGRRSLRCSNLGTVLPFPCGLSPTIQGFQQKSWSTHCPHWSQSLEGPLVFFLAFLSLLFGTTFTSFQLCPKFARPYQLLTLLSLGFRNADGRYSTV